MTLLRMKEAAEYSGFHPQTIRKYIDQGIIQGTRIGTHRFVDTRELDRLMGRLEHDTIPPGENTAVIYARVSTRKQQDNLIRQKERLVKFCEEKKLTVVEIIEDIGSGVIEIRRGLKKVFQLIRKRKIRYIVVEYRDRLTRFGLGYLKELFEDYKVELLVVHLENGSEEEELVRDLIAIVTSFSARLYGRRGAKKIIRAIKEEVNAHGE